MRAIKLNTRVASDRTLRLQLPEDVREGPAEVIVLVPERTARPARTLKDFLAELAAQPRHIRTREEIDRDLEEEHGSWECPTPEPGISLKSCLEAIAAAPLRPKMTWDSLKAITREP